jgi:hypothetical protein
VPEAGRFCVPTESEWIWQTISEFRVASCAALMCMRESCVSVAIQRMWQHE